MERIQQRSQTDRVAAPPQRRDNPPHPAHLTAVTITLPPLINHTVVVPPIIERYPKILKWSGVALLGSGMVLYSKGYLVPGVALMGAAMGVGVIEAFVETFVSEPRHRFHIMDID